MYDIGDDGLPVVVVDLAVIDNLQVVKVVEQQERETPLHSNEKSFGTAERLLSVRENCIFE